jgi:3-hydroxyisobutyrate dehydrogenase
MSPLTHQGSAELSSLILAINQIALAEGVALGKSLGIDPVLLHSVINSSSGMSARSEIRLIQGQSWSSRVNSPSPEVSGSPGERGYTGGFQSRLMLKVCGSVFAGSVPEADGQDVGLALHAAHAYDLPTPLTWAAKSVYEAVCQDEGGEMATQDFRSVSSDHSDDL